MKKAKEREKAMTQGKKETCVYLLICRDNTLYTGWTNDMAGRLAAHNSGKGAKYTRGRGPVRLVYQEWLSIKEEALRREAQIKKMTRAQKLCLIGTKEKENPSHF